jgi:8-oxo-dGTP pyrophosphatase MutT (NUDIX family)
MTTATLRDNQRQDDALHCSQVAALPWRLDADGSVQVLLITSRTNAKWMLPKGWPMADRDDAQAALQEAREEAGIDGLVASAPIGSYHFIKLFDDGRTKPAQAIIYSLKVTQQRSKWSEKGQRKRRWFSPAKAATAVTEPDLARFLRNLADGRVVLI